VFEQAYGMVSVTLEDNFVECVRITSSTENAFYEMDDDNKVLTLNVV